MTPDLEVVVKVLYQVVHRSALYVLLEQFLQHLSVLHVQGFPARLLLGFALPHHVRAEHRRELCSGLGLSVCVVMCMQVFECVWYLCECVCVWYLCVCGICVGVVSVCVCTW